PALVPLSLHDALPIWRLCETLCYNDAVYGEDPRARGPGVMLVAQSMATRLGEGRKAQIITFGCQMNERDAETMRGLLVHMGYTIDRKSTRLTSSHVKN